MPVLPPKEPKQKDTINSGVVFPRWLHEAIGKIAAERGYSRNEVIIHFLKWAYQEHEREEKEQAEREKRAAERSAKK